MARHITLYYNYSPLPWSVLIRCDDSMKWVVAASKVWDWLGPTSLHLEDVFELAISLTTIPRLMSLYQTNLRIDGKRVFEKIVGEREMSIVDVVYQFRNSGATQAVDKVYALPGVHDDGNLPQIQP